MKRLCSPRQHGKQRFPGSSAIPTIAGGRQRKIVPGPPSLPWSKYGKGGSGKRKPLCPPRKGNTNDPPAPSHLVPARSCLGGAFSSCRSHRGDHPVAPGVPAHHRVSGSKEVIDRQPGDYRSPIASPEGRDPRGGEKRRGNGSRHLGSGEKRRMDGERRGSGKGRSAGSERPGGYLPRTIGPSCRIL